MAASLIGVRGSLSSEFSRLRRRLGAGVFAPRTRMLMRPTAVGAFTSSMLFLISSLSAVVGMSMATRAGMTGAASLFSVVHEVSSPGAVAALR